MSATTREPASAGASSTGVRTAQLPPAVTVAAPKPVRYPSWVLKTIMAITGPIWAAFLTVHLVGNLKIYTGPEHFDTYANWLKHAFEPLFPYQGVLWILRAVLLVALLLHIASGLTLWTRGRAARGSFKAKKTDFQSISASLMLLSGVLILCFVIFHLMDLTLGAQPVATNQFQDYSTDQSWAYQNLVASFKRPWSAAIYIGMMIFLALHISHGIKTVAQDLGAMGHRVRALFAIVGGALAVAILLGNASIPIAVLTGIVK